MLKVLIVTSKIDPHARMVSEGLIKKGALPIRWFSEEFLFNQNITQKISEKGEHFITINGENNFSLNEIDVVWYRRTRHAYLPKRINPEDRKFVEAENRMHMTSLWLTLGECAKWVNPFCSFEKSNSKILQLREAARVGLNIPATLISNNKKEIVDFILTNKSAATVYKTFYPPTWEERNVSYGFYTVAITANMLPSDAAIALTPGIYQKIIKKQFEIRVTFFGSECIAVRIHNVDELDWRTIAPFQLKLSPLKIPTEIESKCKHLMERLGIVFGCFDFIVTPEDEYVFLEVNEMGQFLWIEDVLPELRFLDKFCDFLMSKGNQCIASYSPSITVKEIEDSVPYQKLMQEDTAKYKELERLRLQVIS